MALLESIVYPIINGNIQMHDEEESPCFAVITWLIAKVHDD